MSNIRLFKLKDICKLITDGSHNPPKGIEHSNFLMISSKNISNGIISFDNPRYLKEADFYIENKRTNVEPGDVLLTIVGTIGRAAVVPNSIEKFVLQRSVAVLKPNINIVNSKYLMYSLIKAAPELIQESRGVAQKGIYLNQLKNFIIPLPPLDVQNKISHIIDLTYEILNNYKRNIEGLDNLIKVTFYEMFGDPFDTQTNDVKVPLLNIADIIMGQSPKGDSYNSEGIGTPLLNGPTEFGEIYPTEKQWTNEPNKICERDDILFCVRGATAGRMNYADKPYCIGRGLAAIRVKDTQSKEFIYHYLEVMYDFFQSTSSGSTFININKKQLESLPILLPPREQQTLFSKIVRNIEEQKKLAKKSILDTNTLLNSLMSKYFD